MNLPTASDGVTAAAWLDAERAALDAELQRPILIARPLLQSVPVIFCSPHSGRIYTRAFLAPQCFE